MPRGDVKTDACPGSGKNWIFKILSNKCKRKKKSYIQKALELDENLESKYKGLYIIGDGSGVTHSLSHASASGVLVARRIAQKEN